jgi:hypothetical protein
MNTLSKKVTARLADWQAVKNLGLKNFTSGQFLVYLVLLGKDWRKAFHPISRNTRKGQIKIDNGMSPWEGFQRARSEVSYLLWENTQKYNPKAINTFLDAFHGLITLDTLKKIVSIVPFDGTEGAYHESMVKRLLEVEDEAA